MKEHRILIVDDTPVNLQVLGQTLSPIGYNIIMALNGLQALKAVEKQIPDLILLDVNMPEMDGFETCKKLKEQKLYAEIPIIFLTARADTEDIVKGFQAGGNDYITKPFNPVELIARVNFQILLKDKTEELKDSNDRNRRLVRILLHDLLNPIGTIKSANELAMEDKETNDEMNILVGRAADDCISILDSVNKIYTIDDSLSLPQLTAIRLLDTVKSALFLFQIRLAAKKIEIHLDIPEDITVLVDSSAFGHSVFNNLLTNAMKFSFPDSKIYIKSFRENGWVVFSIRDEGMGMPEIILNDIFDVGKPTSRAGTLGEKGTGYGMPLVKRFVEVFGGKIVIKSVESPSPSHGTEVILYLKETSE